MTFATRSSLAWILPAVCLALLTGCAQKVKPVAFTSPPAEEIASEEVDENKLANLPVETLIARGNAYTEQGKLPLAKVHLLKALSLEPESADVYTGIGQMFLKMGQMDKARTAFENALVIDPESFQALVGAGKATRLRGAYDESEKHLHQALLLKPADPEVLTELAICYDSNGQQDKAESLYRQVTELMPESPSGLNNLGFNYLLQGKYPQAIRTFSEALEFAPHDGRVQNNLAAAYILSGSEAKGLALFGNTVGKAGAYNNVGYIYLSQKKWEKAEKAFAKALELNPEYYVKAGKNLDYLKALHAGQSEQATEHVDDSQPLN